MSETRDDLQEALADRLWRRFPISKWQAEAHADALIKDTIAPILTQVSALQAEVEEVRRDMALMLVGDDEQAEVRQKYFDRVLSRAKMAEAEVGRLQKVEGEFAEASRRSVALWQDKYEAAKAELRAVDMAFGGVADSERAERILQWIGEAADAETRASVAEAESEALSLMLADCIAALSQVPLANLPGAVEMMVTSAMEAPIQGALTRQHLAKVAAERMNAFRSALQKVEGERDAAVAALRPFAAMAAQYDGYGDAYQPLTCRPSVAMLRAAQEAAPSDNPLAETKEGSDA